jgi:hypothetical protein
MNTNTVLDKNPIVNWYYCEHSSLRYTPLPLTPHICPTYFHNENITDYSDEK